MAENTHISWADDTFNPWVGCMKVGPACDGCYAEALMGLTGRYKRVEWGAPGQGVGTRVRTVDSTWAKPLKWEKEQAALMAEWSKAVTACWDLPKPPPRFVFCASLADVFDNAVPAEWRRDLFKLINQTPHLTWLLLTKRPQNIVRLWSEACPEGHWGWPRNAAIGCTVVTQDEADRDVPKLLAAKARLNPAFAFLSMEPLLGSVDLKGISLSGGRWLNALHGVILDGKSPSPADGKIDWVITGGETDQGAHKARPSHPDWFRSLRDQCATAGVAYHHKQNGEWSPLGAAGIGEDGPVTDRWGNVRDWMSRYVVFDDDRGAARVRGHSFTQHATDLVYRVGKRRSGRTLDGVIHDARPEARP